jgi:hypothetical protein
MAAREKTGNVLHDKMMEDQDKQDALMIRNMSKTVDVGSLDPIKVPHTEKMYYLLYTYPGQKEVRVMHNGTKVCVCTEENMPHFRNLADQLLKNNLIGKAQFVSVEGPLLVGEKEAVSEMVAKGREEL